MEETKAGQLEDFKHVRLWFEPWAQMHPDWWSADVLPNWGLKLRRDSLLLRHLYFEWCGAFKMPSEPPPWVLAPDTTIDFVEMDHTSLCKAICFVGAVLCFNVPEHGAQWVQCVTNNKELVKSGVEPLLDLNQMLLAWRYAKLCHPEFSIASFELEDAGDALGKYQDLWLHMGLWVMREHWDSQWPHLWSRLRWRFPSHVVLQQEQLPIRLKPIREGFWAPQVAKVWQQVVVKDSPA